MKNYIVFGGILLLSLSSLGFVAKKWGFFGHRRINRMAVFTLPPEMIPFFKKNIEFLTEHAVDPDKRRYATKHEAVRHYIDIDHWGKYPFNEVPRDFIDALKRYTDIYVVTPSADTLPLLGDKLFFFKDGLGQYREELPAHLQPLKNWTIKEGDYRQFFRANIMDQYYEDDWSISCDSLSQLLGIDSQSLPCASAFAVDQFSGYGVLPYHLLVMQNRMTRAFQQKDTKRILRLCAEMGHYIGDAHVPLHTTENYNGQLTNQVGIHAFWESRLPELFANTRYNFFVGKAEYIEDPKTYYWDVILASHELVDSVLSIEYELSQTFPQDKQFCFEERLDLTVRTQCKAYSDAFHKRLGGQVERRMRESVLSIGSAWYTAWVDAGQPDLTKMDKILLTQQEQEELKQLEALIKGGASKGRVHE